MTVDEAIKVLQEIKDKGHGDFELKAWNDVDHYYCEVSIGSEYLQRTRIIEPLDNKDINSDNCFVMVYECQLVVTVVELADTQDLKSCDRLGRAGSSPAHGTLNFC